MSDIAAVAVCRLKNKRHKPSLGIILGTGVDRYGGVERVKTDEFVARGGVGGIQGVPSFGGAACSHRERDYRFKPMIDVFADKLTRIAIYSAVCNVNDIRRVTPVFPRLYALVHNNEKRCIETQMKSVAIGDFHGGIDFAGLSLVAGRLD